MPILLALVQVLSEHSAIRKQDHPMNTTQTTLLTLAAALAMPSAALAARIYVKHDAPGTNTGTSWTNAYRNLRTALDAANSGDEVWVARGTYVPAVPADSFPRHRSFTVDDGVKLYGGFAGTEVSKSQRNYAANPTILSGDIAGNDTPSGGNRAENSLTVLWVLAGNTLATVDGFTIRGANLAEQGVVFEEGGGLKISDSTSVVVANCIIRDNDGGSGSAVGIGYCIDAQFICLANCLISGNRSTGAVFAVGNSSDSFVLSSCTLAGNTSTTNSTAAALEVYGANGADIRNNIFWDNANAGGNGQGAQVYIGGGTTNWHVRYSDIQGGTIDLDPTCISINPCFVDPYGPDGIIGTADDDFRLRRNSRAIDVAYGALVPSDTTDMDGDGITLSESMPYDLARQPREHDDPGNPGIFVSDALDMGAYEYQSTSCFGDLDGNNLVNTADLTRFLGNFGLEVGDCALADLNGDGVVNTIDLVMFLGKFGSACG